MKLGLMMVLSRGDLVLINFNPSKGQEMGKLRPAVVVSNDQDNEILPTIIVVPLSTVLLDDAMPYRLRIKARNKLEKDSDACVNEIRALSKVRIVETLGKLSESELKQLMSCLCQVLSVDDTVKLSR
jgi:mRNA interferase MazF